MSVDRYFGRRYSPGLYNCFHFSVDVWKDLTGEDLRVRLDGLLSGSVAGRSITRQTVQAFRFLDPEPPFNCLVLMQRARSAPHIGVWIRGRVLHIQNKAGVHHMPLEIASLGFRKVRFFLPS